LHHVHDVAVAGHPRWLRLDVHDNDIPEFSLILLDPDQRVRAQYWGKSASEQVVVGLDPTRSSVGTVPGPLAAGSWRVEVFGAGSTRPGAYSVEVEYGSGKAPAGTLPPVGAHSWHATGAGPRRWRLTRATSPAGCEPSAGGTAATSTPTPGRPTASSHPQR